jgi:hypothetical protein
MAKLEHNKNFNVHLKIQIGFNRVIRNNFTKNLIATQNKKRKFGGFFICQQYFFSLVSIPTKSAFELL